MESCRVGCASALWCFATLSMVFTLTILFFVIPSVSFAQHVRYIPSANYPLTDFKEFGMVFEPADQRAVNALVVKLLERERANGCWEGQYQEDIIRWKAKKYYALARNVYPSTARGHSSNSTDNHSAQRSTTAFLSKWSKEHMTTITPEIARNNAAQKYRGAVEISQGISEGKEILRREKAERSRIETADRARAKAEWERQTYEQYDRENAQRASEDKERECERRCKSSYWDSDILYYDCFNMCTRHQKPKEAPIRRP